MTISKRKLGGLAAAALALAAATWAFYTSSHTMENKMSTKTYGDILDEKFTPSKDWQPGQAATKEVWVRNKGDYDLVVRIKLKEEWDRDNQKFAGIDPSDAAGMADLVTPGQADPADGKTDGDKTVVQKTLDEEKWARGTDGYWYCKEKLAPMGSTAKLLTSIKLVDDADMGLPSNTKYWTENETVAAHDPGTQEGPIGTDSKAAWVEYTGAVPSPTNPEGPGAVYTRAVSGLKPDAMGYGGADYTLTIQSETCQATKDAVNALWQTVPPDVMAGWDLK